MKAKLAPTRDDDQCGACDVDEQRDLQGRVCHPRRHVLGDDPNRHEANQQIENLAAIHRNLARLQSNDLDVVSLRRLRDYPFKPSWLTRHYRSACNVAR